MAAGRFDILKFTVGRRRRRAVIWVPPGYDETRAWPLLLSMHGYEERGDDLQHVDQGLGLAVRANPERFPCLVLMPQCPTDLVWAVADQPWAEGHGSAEPHLDAVVHAAAERFRVDAERMTLTGLSMGGFGTFIYGARRARHFASFVAICGGGFVADAAQFVGRPLWVVHGAVDDVVPVELSREMVAAIRAAGAGEELRYSEYPGVTHNSWDQAYADPEIVAFMLAARRPTVEPG